MTMTVNIHGRSEQEVQFLAKRYGVRRVAIVRAVLEDLIDRGELERRIAEIDVEEIDRRHCGRRGKFVVNGKRMSAAELSKVTGLHPTTIANRLEKGWPLERAMNEPPRSRPRFTATSKRAGA